MTFIGTSPPRPDGPDKAAGRALYADDIAVDGLWFGGVVRSSLPHGSIRSIGWRGAAPEGAILLTAADLPGPNGVQLIDDGWPILAEERVEHVGQAVALVAASTREAAALAVEAVAVEIDPLPSVCTMDEARGLEALYELDFGIGDPEPTFQSAYAVVEGCYRTGLQEHIYIECQGMTAWWHAKGESGGQEVEIAGSMQCPYYVHKSVMHAFDLDEDSVRIRANAVGGGFGGKEDFPSLIAIHAALLARAAKQPVRIVFDRHEDIIGTTKRHPSVMHYRSAVDEEGHLLALDVMVELDGGAFTTLSKVVLSRALLHAAGPYRCPAVRVRGRVLRTHTAPNGAFRGFGAPQVAFGIERHIDAIGRRLDIDPLTLRRRNALVPGDRLPTGQLVDETTSALACLEAVARRTDFQRRWQDLRSEQAGGTRRGLGLSLYFHGAGFTGNGERRMNSPATARLDPDGRIAVLSAMTDMGQGSVIVFRQIAAQAAGVTFDDLAFPEPDTRDVPNSGPTVASRTTMIVGQLVARAVRGVSQALGRWWDEQRPAAAPCSIDSGNVVGVDGESVPFGEVARAYVAAKGPLEVTVRHQPPPGPVFDESTYQGPAYPTYAWGADVAEVEVDEDTLAVKPLRVTVATEVGRAIHPRLCIGQIEGGTLQAVGWALWEEIKVQEGRYLNDRLATYIIPTAMDAPDLDVELLEAGCSEGPFGAKGIGELPMDGGAPAIVAAIENATGLVIDEIPATPERLLEAQLRGQADE